MSFGDPLHPRAIAERLLEISKALNEAQHQFDATIIEAANAERDYRKSKPIEWLRVKAEADERGDKLLADELKSRVDDRCADARRIRDIAQGKRIAALELVRSLRVEMSGIQTAAGLTKVEAELAGRYEVAG